MTKLTLHKGDAALVYSRATGRVRRWLVADERGVVDPGLTRGEVAVRVPARYVGDLNQMQVIANAHSGLTPSSDRHVMVDRHGLIVGAVVCDPACGDSVEGCLLIQHDEADADWTITWTHDGPVFVPPDDPVLPPRGG